MKTDRIRLILRRLWLGLITVFLALGIVVLFQFAYAYRLPRYQLTEAKGILVRLDMRTGDMRAFVLSVSASVPSERVRFFDVGGWGETRDK